MKLKQTGPNRTVVTTNNGTQIGFSYETPVVAVIDGIAYRTEQKFSVTTSKHCGQLLSDMPHRDFGGTKPQSFFEGLTQ
jgi:hypothetical protein